MNKIDTNKLIIVSFTFMNTFFMNASENGSCLLSGCNEFTYQIAHSKTIHNKGNKADTVDQFLRITLAPHIAFNTTTPLSDTTHYYRLDKAQYRLGNDRIDLHRLNANSLSIRIAKNKDDSIIVSAYEGWPKCLKKDIYCLQYLPLNTTVENDLQPELRLNFQAAKLKRVLDGKSLPRWVVEITIPIEKDKGDAVASENEKPQWVQIPQEITK